MGDELAGTTLMQHWLDEMREGDPQARDKILHHFGGRLKRLTRRMLQDYPGVRRWEQTDDVLQNAVLRLLRALREVRPGSMRKFFGLAGVQIRRELLDLAKHYYGPEGAGAHHDSRAGGSAAPVPDAVDPAGDPSQLAEWRELHQQIDRLPEEERELVVLLYYQGLSQKEAAAILNVSVRTLQRHWQSTLLNLHDLLSETGWGHHSHTEACEKQGAGHRKDLTKETGTINE
jgi:RNA polymerase sigma-70 factor (ECF subfamily)